MKTIISMHLKRCLYKVIQKMSRSITSQLTQSYCVSRYVFAAFLLMVTAAPNVSASLVGHWTFDEGTGLVAADSSGNGRSGTLLASPNGSLPVWINDGINGNALSFNGTGYVDMANTASEFNFGTSGFTIAAWARYSVIDPNNNNQTLVGKHNGGYNNGFFLAERPTTGNMWFYSTGDRHGQVVVESPNSYNDNQWHFFVGTNDGTTGRLYVDGQYIGSEPGTPIDNSRDFLVGGIFHDVNSGFVGLNGSFYGLTGSIDDVRVYNNALTQAEISQLYTSTVPEPATVWLFGSAITVFIGIARRSP